MLSIKKMGRGSEDYYLNLADYYAAGDGEPPGRWLGQGCPALGLWGEVSREELKPLMRGRHPHAGRPLVQNADAANRVPGWDFTFSPPKGVSLVWSQSDSWLRSRLEEIHYQAVVKAIALAEAQLAYSRTGKGGTGWTPVKLVVAAFEHSTSRNLDPQLHTHCLILNVGVDEFGQTRSLFSKPLFVNRDLLGAYYRAELAYRLRAEGFHLRRHGRSFEIEGISAKLLAGASTRRWEIVSRLVASGRSGGAAAAIATLDTRRTKGVVPPRAELFEHWRIQYEQRGFGDVTDLLHPQRPQSTGSLREAVDAALARLATEQSHFTKTDLIAAALQEAPVLGLPPAEVVAATQAYIEQASIVRSSTQSTTVAVEPPPLVDLGAHGGQQRFTTPEILAEEESMLAAIDVMRGRAGASVPDHVLDWAIEEQLKEVAQRANKAGGSLREPPQLSPEQLAAVRHLAQDVIGTGAIKILRGLAGTGKTDFVLAIVTRALEQCGYHVVAATPTAKAGRILQRDTGLDVDTVTKALGDYELPGGWVALHHLKQLARAAMGQPTSLLPKPEPIELNEQSVLLIDEASMLTTRHMSQLLAHAQSHHATLILSGDDRQLPPVGRGAPLGSLIERVGAVQLTDIKRQHDQWARDVAQHAARGEVGQALSLLAQHNGVRSCDTVPAAMEAMVARWADLGGGRNPAHVTMIASTNAETEELNRIAQQHRLQRGQVDGRRGVAIRDEDEARGIAYQAQVYPGDKILITRNDAGLGVANGMTANVLNVNPITGSISVTLTGGGLMIIPAHKFPHLRLGYAVTTYKIQGDTLPHVVTLVTESQQSLPAFYVQATRARESTTIFTTKDLWDPLTQPIATAPLAEILARGPDLRLASDLREIDAAGRAKNPLTLPPLELSGRHVAAPSAAQAPAAPPPAPATASPAEPTPTFVTVPAAEIAALESKVADRPVASTPPSEAPRVDPLALLTPATPRKRKKKKRPIDFEWEEPLATEENAPPEAVAVEQTPPAPSSPDLPEEFFAVPIPSILDWTPEPPPDAARPSLLPRDFLRQTRPPSARMMPTKVEPTKRERRKSQADAASTSISHEQAKDPAYRRRRRKEQFEAMLAQISGEHNVPPDQIELIGVREWEEESETTITYWLEITYRIRQYGPRDLLKAIAFPVRL